MSNVPVVGGVGLSQTRQPELYAATITTYCLALLALGLRFLSRRLLKSGHGLDDWFAVAAMVRYLLAENHMLTEAQARSNGIHC